MEKRKWDKDLQMGLTIYMDTKTNKPVLFIGGGSEIEMEEGIVSPITCKNPFDIPKHYAALIEAMAETIVINVAKDMLHNLEKLMK
jgi:hypothetical protein